MVREIHKKKLLKKFSKSFKKLDTKTKFSIFLSFILLMTSFISILLLKQNHDLRQRAQSTDSGQIRTPTLSIMLAHWNTNNAYDDLNHDKIVNVIDLSILLSELE